MPKVAQALARHSDLNLTPGVYTDLEMDDLRDAVGRLDGIIKPQEATLPSGGSPAHEDANS
jgi:hypothetical protein